MDDIEPTPEQLLAALDASELVESVGALSESQRGDLLERVALLVGANRSLSVEEFRSELTDILDSGPTFHAVLHGGQFDGQVMELDPEDFDADMICAAVDETNAPESNLPKSDAPALDPSELDASALDAPEADASHGSVPHASGALPSLYRLSAGEPGPGATVHYEFGGLVSVDDAA
ncbi:hypothetical protein GCM10028798_35400 [Humibacter antri]